MGIKSFLKRNLFMPDDYDPTDTTARGTLAPDAEPEFWVKKDSGIAGLAVWGGLLLVFGLYAAHVYGWI